MKKTCALVLGMMMVLTSAFSSPPVLEKAPDFSLKNLNGKEVHSSSFNGKIVLLNFWATWCPPCLAEIPSLKSLYREYQSKGVEVVGINLDEEGPEGVKRFAVRKKINYPILIGNDEVTRAFGGIRGIPTTFLIDREGRIVRRFVGEQEKSVFGEAIKRLIQDQN